MSYDGLEVIVPYSNYVTKFFPCVKKMFELLIITLCFLPGTLGLFGAVRIAGGL